MEKIRFEKDEIIAHHMTKTGKILVITENSFFYILTLEKIKLVEKEEMIYNKFMKGTLFHEGKDVTKGDS